jgi:hypothetical protein
VKRSESRYAGTMIGTLKLVYHVFSKAHTSWALILGSMAARWLVKGEWFRGKASHMEYLHKRVGGNI